MPWGPKGEVMGAALGVGLRTGAFATIGTSFQLPTSLDLGGRACRGGGVSRRPIICGRRCAITSRRCVPPLLRWRIAMIMLTIRCRS